MAVPESQRGENKFEVLVKAQQLTVYTIRICTNPKIFLPEYRGALTDDIVRVAKDIFLDLWTANNIVLNKSEHDNSQRHILQEQAARNCNNLLALMELARPVFHLKAKRIKYWAELTILVRKLIRSWIESDAKRVKP